MNQQQKGDLTGNPIYDEKHDHHDNDDGVDYHHYHLHDDDDHHDDFSSHSFSGLDSAFESFHWKSLVRDLMPGFTVRPIKYLYVPQKLT